MSVVHRTLEGSWAECADASCELKFHFPDMTVAEAAAMPMHALLPLLEVIDPPNQIIGGTTKVWFTLNVWEDVKEEYVPHREYDLPAAVYSNGSLEWWLRGNSQRDNDLPAWIGHDGTMYWRQHGQLHREGGKPAAIHADGTLEWYLNGEDVDSEGNLLYPVGD